METYIRNGLKIAMDNFGVFYLSVNENNKILEPMMKEMSIIAGKENILKKIYQKEIDYIIFGLTISSFVYVGQS